MTDLMKFPGAVEAKWSSGSPTLGGGIFLEGDQWGVWEGRLALATLMRLFEFTPEGAFVSQRCTRTDPDGPPPDDGAADAIRRVRRRDGDR